MRLSVYKHLSRTPMCCQLLQTCSYARGLAGCGREPGSGCIRNKESRGELLRIYRDMRGWNASEVGEKL